MSTKNTPVVEPLFLHSNALTGCMPVELEDGRIVVIHGGPFSQKPKGFQGICLLEKDMPAQDGTRNVHLPIRDFSTPTIEQAVEGALLAVAYALEHRPVYVGCMGGKGRTGLMLGVAAVLCGIWNPVEYVRKTFSLHAIETKQQEVFVNSMDLLGARLPMSWVVRNARYRKATIFAANAKHHLTNRR